MWEHGLRLWTVPGGTGKGSQKYPQRDRNFLSEKADKNIKDTGGIGFEV
jgi:hypothetical protein